MTYEAGAGASGPQEGAELAEKSQIIPKSGDDMEVIDHGASAALRELRALCQGREEIAAKVVSILDESRDLLAVKVYPVTAGAAVQRIAIYEPSDGLKRALAAARAGDGQAVDIAGGHRSVSPAMLKAGADCIIYATDDNSYDTLEDVAASTWKAMLDVHQRERAAAVLNGDHKIPQQG